MNAALRGAWCEEEGKKEKETVPVNFQTITEKLVA